MEAVTIAGLAVVVVGGYYSVVDLIHDMGIVWRGVDAEAKKSVISNRYVVTPKPGIKKMAGMHI